MTTTLPASPSILITKPALTISSEVLGSIITALEQEGVQYTGIKELSDIINNRFNVVVTEEELVNHFQSKADIIQICEIESELLYKLYGY